MSLFRTFDRTTCHSVSNTVSSPLLTFLCPALQQKRHYQRGVFQAVVARAPRTTSPRKNQMDDFFIKALARAGTCQEHRRQISTIRENVVPTRNNHKIRRKATVSCEREYFQTARKRGPFKKMKQFATSELKALVDYYDIELESGPEEEDIEDDGLLIWNVGDDHVPWPVKEQAHQHYIDKLKEMLETESSHEDIFSYYKRLPGPGVVYLSLKTIRDLLHHLSIVERPDQASMHRYLSILDDMKTANIHIRRSEWTSAIFLAGRCVDTVSTQEVQFALRLWKDMEKRAGVKAGVVTFNVLFDIAVKAGLYALAETLLQEMQKRKIKPHRHFRVSMLYYHGMLQNGNAVRQAYQDLVSAGEVVDTVVLNAVIASLIRAGEPAAAEHVFERMKRLEASRQNARPIPHSWRKRRTLGLELTWEGARPPSSTNLTDKANEIHQTAPIAPDSRTYGLFIRHHATTTGNIDRIEDLLQDMMHKKIPIDGTTFIVMMYGFHSFGGVRYSSWTREKLERTWSRYLQGVRDGADRTWLSPLAIKAALRGFKKCTDDERTLRVWEEARELWDPSPHDLESVLKTLRRMLPDSSFFSENV
ncbi:hypothetical protein BU24DRAFT_424665 [Aaosphaeria arxii CBS 175.79]|uniref:Pentatricopeptide repeat protein-like protein n=1 Tax=Aaosphaeria arxii CBS 175.79 TaxID=1450172 RepID=A0A6A5XL45_9PLEO|nr:uncharacterized protein BU24DRAFT_424665 [Aaosphaeria arxii CBS 175.79]KAF2013663.1 hypothetical protein BU24DRAFT_424665 [Aaosphaeria arxii CBS 175.79]